MVTVQHVSLRFLIIVLIRINFNDALPFNTVNEESAMGIISRLLGKRSRGPVVIILNKSNHPNSVLRTSNNLNRIDAEDDNVLNLKHKFDDTIDDEKTKKFVKEILRSTGDENNPIVKKTQMKYRNALRDRCSAYIKCEISCEPKKKKKKADCEKSCKEVFDYLMLCHPPGGKKRRTTKKPKTTTKKDSCESSDECDKKDSCASKGTCEESKDSCASRGTCEESKNSCESDDCKIDSCAETDECAPSTKGVILGTGRTMPPKWRF